MEAPKKPSMVGATRTVPATATTAGPASTTYATIVSTGSAGTARASPLGDAPPPGVGGKEKLSDAQRNIQRFWPAVMRDVQQVDSVEPGNQLLPLARIKKIMKLDEDVKMISSDAPLLFAKAIEIFIQELTLRAWQHTEHNKRRTLQRSDIAMAITKYDQFDFLIDIVPRDEIKKEFDGPKPDAEGTAEPDGAAATEDLQYILQLAQQQLAQQTGKVLDLTAVRTVPISHQEQAVMQAVADALAAKKTHPPMATAATAAAAPSGVAMASRTGTLTAMKLGKVVPAGVDQQTAAIAIAPTTLQQQSAIQTATGQSIILANGNATATTTTTTMATAAAAASGGGTVSSTTGPTLAGNQTVQLLQHVISPSGEITQIPISIPQSQLNFIRATGSGTGPNGGPSIFIQAAPQQTTQPAPTIVNTGTTGVFLSANQLQQLQLHQQQQQQQQLNQSQQQHPLQPNHQQQRE
uniref:Nuclear transcription factor Y subunit gamma n=1 Tax=Anopheles dirus TaxID=7168 RepID=A0A182N198_9DIPT